MPPGSFVVLAKKPLIEDFDVRDIKVRENLIWAEATWSHISVGATTCRGKDNRVGCIAELGELTPGGYDWFMRRGGYFSVLATFCYIFNH